MYPLPTIVRIDACPGWGPGGRSSALLPFANATLAEAGFLTATTSVRHKQSSPRNCCRPEVATTQTLSAFQSTPTASESGDTPLPDTWQPAGTQVPRAGARPLALPKLTSRRPSPSAARATSPDRAVPYRSTAPHPSLHWSAATPGRMWNNCAPQAHSLTSPPTHRRLSPSTAPLTKPANMTEHLHRALLKEGADTRLLPIPGGLRTIHTRAMRSRSGMTSRAKPRASSSTIGDCLRRA